jgi:hypothetical protein
MTALMATLITCATFPGVMTITGAPSPPRAYAVIPGATDCIMIECPPIVQFALSAEVRSATGFVIDASGVYRGTVQMACDYPEPTPATREIKITTWPKNPIQSWGWVTPALEKYIHEREKNHLFLLGMWYNSEIKKYEFRWRTHND